jgi:hypothetical protein
MSIRSGQLWRSTSPACAGARCGEQPIQRRSIEEPAVDDHGGNACRVRDVQQGIRVEYDEIGDASNIDRAERISEATDKANTIVAANCFRMVRAPNHSLAGAALQGLKY